MEKFEQQSKTSGVHAPNNSGIIGSGNINNGIIGGSNNQQIGVGGGVRINNKGGQFIGCSSGGGNTQIMYSDNSKSTVVDNREGVMQRSNIGNSSDKSFSKCPYCGEGLNLPKTPKFCPHCGEQMIV